MYTRIYANETEALTHIKHRFEVANPYNFFAYPVDNGFAVLEDVAADEAPLLDALFSGNISPVYLFTRGETSSLADFVFKKSVVMCRNSYVKRHTLSSTLIRHYLKTVTGDTATFTEDAQGTRDRYAFQALLTSVFERETFVVYDSADDTEDATVCLSHTSAEANLPELLDHISAEHHVVKNGVTRNIPLRIQSEITYRLVTDEA